MSISAIISQDITLPLSLPPRTAQLTSREKLVFDAYENESWLSGKDFQSSLIEQKMLRVDKHLLFQILMIENVSDSKASQVDNLKAKFDPKSQRVDRVRQANSNNYKVITQVDMEDGDQFATSNENSTSRAKNLVYKLVLQSKSGSIFYAINAAPLPWINCMLGSKIVIKPGTIFNRGVFMLRETDAVFYGGINRVWNENKEEKVSRYLELKLQEIQKQKASEESKKRKASSMS